MQVNPTWMAQHPHAVAILYALALVLVTLTAVQFGPVQRLMGVCPTPNDHSAPLNNSGMYAGRDNPNKGRQFVAGTVNYHEGAVPHQPPVNPSPAASKPHLISANVKRVENGAPFVLSATRPQNHLYVLPIENSFPEKGNTSEATDVCASIRFKREGTEEVFVERTYWLGTSINEVTIAVQAVRSVVLGRYINGAWFCFINEDRPDFFIQSTRSPGPPPRAIRITLVSGPITADVSVFDTSGQSYIHESYLIAEIGENDVQVRKLS
jgi:hypothetical protein